MWYKLVNKVPVPATDADMEYIFDDDQRRIGLTELPNGGKVSTVFLGLDHSHGGDRPVLFESMAFLPEGEEQDCVRYFTYDEAERGHREMVLKYGGAVEYLDEDLFNV